MSVKIAFTDVDGTLVNNDHHSIPASAKTLQRVTAKIPLCLISARSPEGPYPIQEQLGFTGSTARFSGAYCWTRGAESSTARPFPSQMPSRSSIISPRSSLPS